MGADDAATTVEDFTAALKQLEQTRDVEPMTRLFSEDAELRKLDKRHGEHGREGARRFWLEYRDAFDDVTSRFSSRTEQGDRVVLEWTSDTTSGEASMSYHGVSVLEFGNGLLTGFRTYYDSGAFVSRA